MIKAFKYAAPVLLLMLAIILFSIAIMRLQLPYENGRYFDETSGVVILQQSIPVYLLFSFITVVFFILMIKKLFKKRL